MKEKTYLKIKARDIVPSSVLPPREHSKEIGESVRQDGMMQFPIVRPSVKYPFKSGCIHDDDGKTSIYESIDGSGRVAALNPEEDVLVEVRLNASDAEVFKISEATHKRTQRNAYESAQFYAAYVNAVKKEIGEEGALSRVAREAVTSPSQLSQYMAINNLFTKLAALKPEAEFRNLKSMGINSLYNLSRLIDHKDLLEVALVMEEKEDELNIEAINEIVDNKLGEVSPDIEEMIGDHLPAADTAAMVDDSISSTRSKALSEKLSKMIKQLNTILPQIETEAVPQKESMSLDTLKIMERTSATLRRLLYYLRKLKRAQKQAEAKTTDTTCDAQASTAGVNDNAENGTQ